LATACVIDLAFGPCQGKQTGESALPVDATVTRRVAGGTAEAVHLSMFPRNHEAGATKQCKAARICAQETSRSMWEYYAQPFTSHSAIMATLRRRHARKPRCGTPTSTS